MYAARVEVSRDVVSGRFRFRGILLVTGTDGLDCVSVLIRDVRFALSYASD